MPRIHDARNDSPLILAGRAIVFLVACVVAIVLLRDAGDLLGAPTSAFTRYRTPVAAPRVFVSGKIRHRDTAPRDPVAERARLPALCHVEHERWLKCGKNHCWRTIESFDYSDARIDITNASGPLPPSMELAYDFVFEPWTPGRTVLDNDARSKRWRSFAQATNLGFAESGFGTSDDRIVETCAPEDEPVFLQACISPVNAGQLTACRPDEKRFGVVVNGDAQAVLDDAADDVARYVGGAAAALLVAALAWLRPRRAIITGLESRAAPHRKTLGPIWALLGVPPVLAFSVVFMHGSHPPSSWSTGRGGFAFALSTLAVWLFFALQRWLHRRRTLFALGPVLATPRSPLAAASGTAELAVRARGDELRSFIGDEPVAYSEIVITETYRAGRNTSSREVYRGRQRDRLKVVDESGEGVLDLVSSVLDVEQRSISMPVLSPRYLERGISVDPHARHVSFQVVEWVIKDGEPLYVLGEVSDIVLQASEGGYRTVRGSPTLGSKDAAPLLVHSGDERGLIALLSREVRSANGYVAIAAGACTGIVAALALLARL